MGKNYVQYLVPVIFRNVKGYDSYHIFKNLTRFYAPKDVIETNTEKYLALGISALRFLDSMQFLNCSLDTLATNLSKDGNSKFKHMRGLYPKDNEFELPVRKGVYPCEYMDSADRMSETCFPPKDEFFSHLTDEHITDADYRQRYQQFFWR